MSGLSWLVSAAVFGVMAAACAPISPTTNPAIRSSLGAEWLRWPPDDGCVGTEIAETLPPGTMIDRYGSDNGHFFSVPGTPYSARALPYDQGGLPHTNFVIRKRLAVEECTTAPWFGELGGGIQYKTTAPAAQLKAEGVITSE